MTSPGSEATEAPRKSDGWLAARWQWVIVGVLLLFALNNLVGIVVGALGAILFANRVAGRVLGAQRVARQLQQIVSDSEDQREEP